MSERMEIIDPTDICDFAMAYDAYSTDAADVLTTMRILLEERQRAGLLDAFPGLVNFATNCVTSVTASFFLERYVLEAAEHEQKRRTALAGTPCTR